MQLSVFGSFQNEYWQNFNKIPKLISILEKSILSDFVAFQNMTLSINCDSFQTNILQKQTLL